MWRHRFSVSTSLSWTGESQAGKVGCSRRTTGPGEILWGEDFRGLHLETYARLLLLRGLRTLLRPVSGQRRGQAACHPDFSPSKRGTTAFSTIRFWAVRTTAHLIGGIYSEDEIWSCTTCGACEAECPLLVEYIDKIVDLRRGMVDDGNVPQSLQKPLKALESRGNPYGKLEKKRADWAKAKDFEQACRVTS